MLKLICFNCAKENGLNLNMIDKANENRLKLVFKKIIVKCEFLVCFLFNWRKARGEKLTINANERQKMHVYSCSLRNYEKLHEWLQIFHWLFFSLFPPLYTKWSNFVQLILQKQDNNQPFSISIDYRKNPRRNGAKSIEMCWG